MWGLREKFKSQHHGRLSTSQCLWIRKLCGSSLVPPQKSMRGSEMTKPKALATKLGNLRFLCSIHTVEGEIKVVKLSSAIHACASPCSTQWEFKNVKQKKSTSRLAIPWLFSSLPFWQAWTQAIDAANTWGLSESKQGVMKYPHLTRCPSATPI